MDPQIANLLSLGDQMRDAIKIAARRGAPPTLSARTIARSYLAIHEALAADAGDHATFPPSPATPSATIASPASGLVPSGAVWEEDFSGESPLAFSTSDVGFLAGRAVGPSKMFIRDGAGFASGKTLALVSSMSPAVPVNNDAASTYPDTRVMSNNGLSYVVRRISSANSFYFFARFRVNYVRALGTSARFRIMLYSGSYGLPLYQNNTEHWYRPLIVPEFGMPTTMQATSVFSCVVECRDASGTAYFSYMPGDADPDIALWGTVDRNEVPLAFPDGSTLFNVPYGKWINVGFMINNVGSKPVISYAISAPPDPNAKFVRDDATENIATVELTETVETRDLNVASQPNALWMGIDNLQTPFSSKLYVPEVDIDVDYLQADYQDILHPIVTFPTPPDINALPPLGSVRQEYIAYAVRTTTVSPGESVVLQFLALMEHDGSYVSPVGDILHLVGGAGDASPTPSAEFVWSGGRAGSSAPDTPSYPMAPFDYADGAKARSATFSFMIYTTKGGEGQVTVTIGSAEQTYTLPSGVVEPYKSISETLSCSDVPLPAVEITSHVDTDIYVGPGAFFVGPNTPAGDNSYLEGLQQISIAPFTIG